MEKGQIGVEYITITTFVLLVLGALLVASFFLLGENSRLVKADGAVEDLAQTIDRVYSIGEGAVLFVEIDLPNGIVSHRAIDSHVSLIIETTAGNTEFYRKTEANITPRYLPTEQGRYEIKVEMIDENIFLSEM